jgi:hypothetical protein
MVPDAWVVELEIDEFVPFKGLVKSAPGISYTAIEIKSDDEGVKVKVWDAPPVQFLA